VEKFDHLRVPSLDSLPQDDEWCLSPWMCSVTYLALLTCVEVISWFQQLHDMDWPGVQLALGVAVLQEEIRTSRFQELAIVCSQLRYQNKISDSLTCRYGPCGWGDPFRPEWWPASLTVSGRRNLRFRLSLW
jgi:hypothetical protein